MHVLKSLIAVVLVFTVAVCFVFTSAVFAQLDPGFGTGGVATVVTPGSDRPVGSFVLPGGKILVVNGTSSSIVYQFLRFNEDGTPDSSYGSAGRVTLPIPFISQSVQFPPAYIYNAIRQDDGKIVLVGTDNSDGLIVRLNEDGTLDTTFSEDGIHRPNLEQLGFDTLNDVVQQPDGKLLAAGGVQTGLGSFSAIRYEANGEVDSAFGDHGGYIIHDFGVPAGNPTLALQSTGKFLNLATESHTVFRFNADGTLDNTFASPSLSPEATGLRVLTDDRFIILGFLSKNDSLLRLNDDITVNRYERDGQPDLTFGTGGAVTVDVTSHFYDYPMDIVQQSDGKIVVGAGTDVPANRGSIKGRQVSLIRLNADGSVDGKYLVADAMLNVGGFVMLQPDGKIVTVTTAVRVGNDIDLVLTRSTGIPSPNYLFHGIPFQLNYVEHSVAAIYRPGNTRWYINPGTIDSLFFGLADDILVPSDYFGAFHPQFSLASEVAVFRPSNGTWYIGKDYIDPAHDFVAVPWGTAGDIPAPADYDGDGKSEVAVFRPSTGIWYIKNIGNDSAWALPWGIDGDKPVPGDYDGDGIYDVAVYRPSAGFWYIIRSSDGQPMYVPFGTTGDIPVQEDYDGDGKFDIAVWRPSNGFWYVLRSSDGEITYFNWGISTDVPAPADYDGDHITDFAVWRPSPRIWYIKYSSGAPTNPFIFGVAGDRPIPGRELEQTGGGRNGSHMPIASDR